MPSQMPGRFCNVVCKQGTDSVIANARALLQRRVLAGEQPGPVVYNDDSSPNAICLDQTANSLIVFYCM